MSPLCKALPRRVTPELEYLQVEWAAHLPYRQATALLKEVLPSDKQISFSGTRQRIHAVARLLDAEVDRDIANQPKAAAIADTIAPPRESPNVACVSVDSAWLTHHSTAKGREAARAEAKLRSPWSQPPTLQRHVNIVAGRAAFADRAPRVYAYVHKQVPSAAARLDQFLARSGVGPDERVTVISDDAGEFAKAVEGSQLARGRILDWFHIAMKFKAAENSVFRSAMIEPPERAWVQSEIRSAKWFVWHGKGGKSVARIKALDEALMARTGFEYSNALVESPARVWLHQQQRRHAGGLRGASQKGLGYQQQHRRVGSDLVVSHRMAKKQQMQWTDEGAHCLAQVPVAALNRELSPGRLAKLAKASRTGIRQSCHPP
ncbi:hypothetical protein [Variovorax rhizosphaerae]|uniref:ISKra4 family transposase n=1 Tax=Variovorax rhizosphaerae TaxID=1836200 RepID=A0ABU8WRP3_9BURK